MSIVDHFDRTPDAGFTHGLDPKAARRQFNMSLGLVTVLAVATVSAAFTLGLEPRHSAPAGATRLVVEAPQIVHVRQASRLNGLRPGS